MGSLPGEVPPDRLADAPGGGGGVKKSVRQVAQAWGVAVRRASAGRRAYEVVLALVLSGEACFSTAAYGVHPAWLTPSMAAALVGVTSLLLVPLRLVHGLGVLVAGASLCLVGEAFMLTVVLSWSAGYRSRSARRLVLALAVCLGLWTASIWQLSGSLDAGTLVLATASFTLLCVCPAWGAWTIGRRRRLLATMHWRNIQLHDQQASVAREARERERRRIARDLHDSVGHRLTLVSLYAGTLESQPDERRGEVIALLRSATSAAMDELRLSLGVLSDGDTPHEPDSRPLSAVNELAEGARSAGARLTVDQQGPPRELPSFIEHTAFRTLQEGVTNALKHARGSPIRITLRWEPDVLVAEVVNGPGSGHGGPSTRQGLIGLDERIRLAGGILHHGRTEDHGYRVVAMLPYTLRHADAERDVAAAPPTTRATSLPARLSTSLAAELAGRDAAGDFAETMRRQARQSRLRLAALVTGLLLVLSVFVAALAYVYMAPDWTVEAETFHTARVGQREDEVRARLPDPAAAVTDAVGGQEPPQGATCIDYDPDLVAQLSHDSLYDLVYRFCFREGVLIHKEAYDDLTSA